MLDGSRNPISYLFSAMWHYSAHEHRRIVLFWSFFAIAETVHVFGYPFVWAQIITTVQLKGVTEESISELISLLALIVVLELLLWCLHGPGRYLEEATAFCIRRNYRRHLLWGVLSLPLDWHSEHHSGDTIDKIEKGTSGLYEFSRVTFQLVYRAIQLTGSFAVLAYFSLPAGGIVAGSVLLVGVIIVTFDRVLVKQYEHLNQSENIISESVFDAVSNVSTVIILRVEKLVFDAIMHKVEEPFALLKLNTRINEWKWFTVSMCCYVMSALVLGVYFWQHLGTAEGVLVGSVFLLIQYLGNVRDQFYEFTTMYGELLRRKARVLNAERLSVDFRPENLVNHVLPAGWRQLDVTGLTFSYDQVGVSAHLDDVSFSARRGERIALVGESGSGKTTLLKLMRDLYHPQRLTLSVDGEIIPEGFPGISRAIALVPQDPEIFATTILENITLGADYEDDLIDHYVAMACFESVVESLPQKLHSSIKEKGVNLSGGQQQRLALARGLLACHGKDVVLLDEPTSSLDAKTEMQVYRNIFQGFPDKTIISSIHRLHLLPLFDRICMFERGRIVASGTFDELLTACPAFTAMWEAMQHDETRAGGK